MRPKKPLPASPIKIFAGGKFQSKKPNTGAPSSVLIVTAALLMGKHSMANTPNSEMAFTLAMPSMKLNKLSIPTRAMISNLCLMIPKEIGAPKNINLGKPLVV